MQWIYAIIKILIIIGCTILTLIYCDIASIGFLIGCLIVWTIFGNNVPNLIYYKDHIYKLHIDNGKYAITFNNNAMQIKKINNNYENAIVFKYYQSTETKTYYDQRETTTTTIATILIIKNGTITPFKINENVDDFLHDNLNAAIKEFNSC